MRAAEALPGGVGALVDLSLRSRSAKEPWLSKSSVVGVLGQDATVQKTKLRYTPTGATFPAVLGAPPRPTAAEAPTGILPIPTTFAKSVGTVLLSLILTLLL